MERPVSLKKQEGNMMYKVSKTLLGNLYLFIFKVYVIVAASSDIRCVVLCSLEL